MRSVFELRGVNHERRTYFRLEDHVYDRYHDACLAADVAFSLNAGDVIVWEPRNQRVLYDSRLLARGVSSERRDEAKT